MFSLFVYIDALLVYIYIYIYIYIYMNLLISGIHNWNWKTLFLNDIQKEKKNATLQKLEKVYKCEFLVIVWEYSCGYFSKYFSC
jgi:uncharacterized membrane protein